MFEWNTINIETEITHSVVFILDHHQTGYTLIYHSMDSIKTVLKIQLKLFTEYITIILQGSVFWKNWGDL